jgi:uncharacterized protein with GYD domain
MAKYLWQVSYSTDGVRGLLKEGGTSRRALVEQIVKEAGGNLEAFYFAFGEDDAYVIADLPNDATASAISLTVAASGAAHLKTVKLLMPEEIDDATQISIAYRPPGA